MGFLTLSLVGCTSNRDCALTQACVGQICQEPCAVHNPCARHAVCINTNHGTDCSCEEGYHGNGFVTCNLGKSRYIITSVIIQEFFRCVCGISSYSFFQLKKAKTFANTTRTVHQTSFVIDLIGFASTLASRNPAETMPNASPKIMNLSANVYLDTKEMRSLNVLEVMWTFSDGVILVVLLKQLY